ncbi:bifunctional phosphopantothenoylcysteine decarboxylase/phosphopantothenate--cysteine ligase CoaBC [Nesterenkonia sp. CL21]|uniref:bifunctional phosphopantothenoylcysteine decarboxylase/phosphopantothenate--cysteine ligase CoaBC n=1 Tax=Nesterenkonia sp. CL21 TaxID=3064894 RepID=UPI00287A9E25|nr:bifunctional phosphopantothenoylcysteine decarboxylase/phosphopantothenate--cysteine ligase CoaBC [Nesterenkonia sp. CL21]MDS2171763.1 bifunctional phosphopantothenoylcysteine decarboxylase/phosphopantothenate--cysteine ligase CoaBC [Nesterenkonia sp. CL21]
MRIVLGVSGGIAAYKAVHLVRLLREDGHQVDVVPTAAAEEFVGRPTWEAISGRKVSTSVFSHVDEVRHVRLGQEADLVVVAPATADLMARVRAGMADDLLTSTLLATEAPVVLVPAMHTEMWRNAATADNVEILRRRGVDVMEPAVGRLTGADSGPGRMPEPHDIHAHLRRVLAEGPGDADPGPPSGAVTPSEGPLSGRRVVVTAGGTREPLDPVRYLGNRSSGKQGLALAEAALAAGAQVHLIAGVMDVPAPAAQDRLTVETVETAEELHAAVESAAAAADMLLMAAAVADFRPANYAEAKIKKTDDGTDPVIHLQRNPDILATTVRRRAERGTGPTVIVGFAAETGDAENDPLDLAQAKLLRKGCELLVLNRVGRNLVFGQDDTEIHILASFGVQGLLGESEPVHVVGTKQEAAGAVVDRAAQLLSRQVRSPYAL